MNASRAWPRVAGARARNLHANAVRVIEAIDPYAPTPKPVPRVDDSGYTAHRADPNGNTVFDGEYFYQYDAWNRLVQVNKRGTLDWVRFPYTPDPNGSFAYFTKTTSVPAECPGSDVGELVKHFTYDGVGRLIRGSSPIEAGEGYFFAGNSPMPITTFTRSERFYYDGTRRIQERELPWCAGNAITGSLRCRTRRAKRG